MGRGATGSPRRGDTTDGEDSGRAWAIVFVNVNDAATVATAEVGLGSTARSSRTMVRTRVMKSSSPRFANRCPDGDGSDASVAGASLIAEAVEGGGGATVDDLRVRRVE